MNSKRLISLILFAATVLMHARHLLSAFNPPPGFEEMLRSMDLTMTATLFIFVPTSIALLLIFFRATYVVGNAILATTLVTMASVFIKIGNFKGALIEVPFILMPLLMIYLGYPLNNLTKVKKITRARKP